MKNLMLFGINEYEAIGGMNDLIQIFETVEEINEYIRFIKEESDTDTFNEEYREYSKNRAKGEYEKNYIFEHFFLYEHYEIFNLETREVTEFDLTEDEVLKETNKYRV